MPEKSVETPLGWITLTEREGAITALHWGRRGDDETPLLQEATGQLAAYFTHDLTTFDLPLKPGGDAFQQSVNRAMQAIPYGETLEYGDIARALGSMPQPVGQACGGNTIGL